MKKSKSQLEMRAFFQIFFLIIPVVSYPQINSSVVLTHDTIFEEGRLFFNHTSSVVVLDSGYTSIDGTQLIHKRIIVSAFGGKSEGFQDNIVWLTYSDDNGQTWAKIDTITSFDEVGGTEELGRDPLLFEWKGKIYLLYRFQIGVGSGAPAGLKGRIRSSIDNGQHWSPPLEITLADPQLDSTISNFTTISYPIKINENLLGFPFYYRFIGDSQAYFGFMTSMNMESFDINLFPNINLPLPDKAIEPAGYTINDTIRLYFRNNFGRLLSIFSIDQGFTWSDWEITEIPDPGSRPSLFYKHPNLFIGSNNSFRSRDNLFILKRNLETNEDAIIYLDKAKLPTDQRSYPSIFVDNEDFIHVTYSFIEADSLNRRYGDILYAGFSIENFRPLHSLGSLKEMDFSIPTSRFLVGSILKSNVIAGLENTGTIYVSTNSGQDWEAYQIDNSGGTFNDLAVHNSTLYVSSSGLTRGIFKSTNWGETWEKFYSPNSNVFDVKILNDSIFACREGNNALAIFRNEELENRFVLSEEAITNFSYNPYNNIIYIFSKEGEIFASTDNGHNFSALSVEENVPVIKDTYFLSESTAIAVTFNGRILKTDNSCSTWTTLYSSSDYNHQFEKIYPTDTSVLVISSASIMEIQNEEVDTTFFLGEFLPQLIDMGIVDNEIAFLDYQGSLYLKDTHDIVNTYSNNHLPKIAPPQLSLYPNPCTDNVTIEILDREWINRSAELSIFDGKGCLVTSKKLILQETQKILLSDQPSGIYSLLICLTDSKCTLLKLIVL